MPKVFFGDKSSPSLELKLSDDLIAVRTRSGKSLSRDTGPVAKPVSADLQDSALIASYPDAGVEVLRVPVGRGKRSLEDRKKSLSADPDVRFAGGVLVDPSTSEPVLYTENLFIKFVDSADPVVCREVLRAANLTIKEEVKYATNAFFVEAPEGTGRKVFDIAIALLKRDDVEYCHPELIRSRKRKLIFPQQWHLAKTTIGGVTVDAHANVDAAHKITRGEGVVVAIIDDGIDIDHLEFGGVGKIVAARDATLQTSDPRPKGTNDNHGTACAGVAVAAGVSGASGVAPAATLMPIRLASGLGSQREADAFVWAADHGADVISCSWGPQDGDWWDPNDPTHSQVAPLPSNTRLAIDYVTNNGRGGKGCVVLFAAGNGNESVDNDGYASNPKVIAVAACNDTGKRSVYSDFGKAVWCAFPSSDFGHAPFSHPDPQTSGIWTVDRVGTKGYNSGSNGDGDHAGMFTGTFGGTSSACPGAAGVVALALSVNPGLKWHDVKDLLRRGCDRVDPQGGRYDAGGHSEMYGYGRLNALTVVELARPQPRNEVTVTRRFDLKIPDMQSVSFSLDVPDNAPVESVSVGVDIKHTYVGDLIVKIEPPAAMNVSPITLHNRTGGAGNAIKRIYDKASTPALGGFTGKTCNGTWTLRVQDAAAEDEGTLISFSVRLVFALPGQSAPGERATVRRRKAAGTKPPARKGRRRAV